LSDAPSHPSAAASKTEVAELRADVPRWIHWAAIITSVVLAWMGLGQFALVCLGRRLCCESRSE
jgi:hypothetical protein